MLGRLTLNPLSHMDPFGTVLLFVAGFGWGKPVPYNPSMLKNGAMSEVLIALAGPASNIIVAFLLALPTRFYIMQNQTLPEGQIYVFLATVVTLNIFLAAFNLIPIPPLDGSKVLYFAGYKKLVDRYKVAEIEAAADIVVWCCDESPGFAATRPQDKSYVGNIVQAMVAYGSGELGTQPVALADADHIIAIGSDRMMAAVGVALSYQAGLDMRSRMAAKRTQGTHGGAP